jgi:hypothetical protein
MSNKYCQFLPNSQKRSNGLTKISKRSEISTKYQKDIAEAGGRAVTGAVAGAGAGVRAEQLDGAVEGKE